MIRTKLDSRRLGWMLSAFAAAAVAGGVAHVRLGYGQQAAPARQALPKQASSQAQEKRKAPRRLPPYYARVVNQTQRERIYEIQAKYYDQIQALQEQLEALVAQRNAEIEAVLTPEQREQLMKLRAEAAAKRRGAPDAEAAAPDAASSAAGGAKKPARPGGN